MGSRPTGKRRVRLFIAEVLALFALLALGASPALAGTLANVSWSVSNSQSARTAVTYAFSCKTATAGIIKSVTLTVPSGTGGTIAVGSIYGLGAGTVSLAANTIIFTLTTAVSLAANIPIHLSFVGLTNTSSAGLYTSTVTTQTSAPATIDLGTSQAVTCGSSSATATVTVAQTLTFTNDTLSLSFALDPTDSANRMSQAITLTVQTNAADGYTLAASDNGLSQTGPAYTIPAVSSGPGTGVATFPDAGFGASATVSGGGSDGATLASGLSDSKFVGYPSSPTIFLTATSPTGTTPDKLVLANQVQIDYTVPAGTYSDTITYVVTPSY